MKYETPEIRIEKFELSEKIANDEASSTVTPDGPIEEANDPGIEIIAAFKEVFNIF